MENQGARFKRIFFSVRVEKPKNASELLDEGYDRYKLSGVDGVEHRRKVDRKDRGILRRPLRAVSSRPNI